MDDSAVIPASIPAPLPMLLPADVFVLFWGRITEPNCKLVGDVAVLLEEVESTCNSPFFGFVSMIGLVAVVVVVL